MFYACILLMVVPSILADRVILFDLSPEEAQKYISGKSLDLSYAKIVDQGSLEQYADKHEYYDKGRLIDNPNDFVHTQYEANQFQAQDGLGRTMFGFTDWNQGRLEARNANGEIRGSYQFVDPNGENVIVNYWSDSLGYHQMDNRPKISLESVTETAEVREARLAHARAWEAAAKAALENPDPLSDSYNENANRLDEEQTEIKEVMEVLTGKRLSRESKTDEVQSVDDSVAIETINFETMDQVRKARDDETDANEELGPPRGFYYHIDYPVHVVSLVEGSKKFKRSDDASELKSPNPAAEITNKNDQIALETMEPVTIVTAEQSHPNSDEKVLVVDAIRGTFVEPPNVDEPSPKDPEVIDAVEIKENEPPNTDEPAQKDPEAKDTVEILENKSPSIVEPAQKDPETKDDMKSEENKPEETKQPDVELTPPKEKIPIEERPKEADTNESEEKLISELIFDIDPKISEEPLMNQIPVEIKLDESPKVIPKSAEDAEAELRKLATNEDAIDAVHDTQVHPKQLIKAE